MRAPTTQFKLAIILGMVALMLVFTRATGLTLIAMAIGAITAFMGMWYTYRQASAIGVLIISGAAAAAIEITSLTEVGALITTTFGLVIPVIVLMLVSLSAESEETKNVVLRRRPIIMIVGFITVCVLSVPLFALVMSLVAPGVATRLPVLTEAAILLVVTIGALTALTWREPRVSVEETGE